VLESAIATLDCIESTSSTSQSSLSPVRVTFNFGTTSAKVTELLNNAVDSVKATLPAASTPKVFSGGKEIRSLLLYPLSYEGKYA